MRIKRGTGERGGTRSGRKTAAIVIDRLIFVGCSGLGLVNFIFFIMHMSFTNLAGIFMGTASISFVFMGVSAFVLLGVTIPALWLALKRRQLFERIVNSRAWRVIRGALVAGAGFFIVIVAMIFFASLPKDIPVTSEMLILGAQVSSDRLSSTLKSRLDTGLPYLREHPEINVIVCGGQGLDEPTTEAVAMRDYLLANGIDAGRITLEEQSHNTFENLSFARVLIPAMADAREPYPITIVTSEFHVLRTSMIAERVGFKPYFVPAKTSFGVLIGSYSREFFGIIKSFLLDRE